MTPERLQEIETRAAAATRGPWEEGPAMRPMGYSEALWGLKIGGRNRECEWDEADMRFIAHAREDVPALVAEVRRLRAQEADQRALIRERDALRAEVERLSDRLEDIERDAFENGRARED